MKIVAWMLIRMIGLRFIGILLGHIDLRAVARRSEQCQGYPGAAARQCLDHGRIFADARAQRVFANYLGLSILLAMLLSLTELSYRNEMVALWGSGVSPARLCVMLLPLAFLAGGLQFVLNDTAIPATTPQLREWGVGDYGSDKLKVGEKDPIWMRAGPDILRAGSANAEFDQPRRT